MVRRSNARLLEDAYSSMGVCSAGHESDLGSVQVYRERCEPGHLAVYASRHVGSAAAYPLHGRPVLSLYGSLEVRSYACPLRVISQSPSCRTSWIPSAFQASSRTGLQALVRQQVFSSVSAVLKVSFLNSLHMLRQAQLWALFTATAIGSRAANTISMATLQMF